MGAPNPSSTHHPIHTPHIRPTTLGTNHGCWGGEAPQSPAGEQAVPGSILDVATFFYIMDFQLFNFRLSTVGAQVGQAEETL